MALDVELLTRCLDETDQEIIRVGRDRHEHLRENTKLAAVFLLLLRCVSLFRSMMKLAQSQRLDAFDAVRRAYLEGWLLAFQFRIDGERGDAGKWLASRGGSWMAEIFMLEEYAKGRGHDAPDLGNDYGELSELAHPTRAAAENSAALTLWRLGLNADAVTVEQAIASLDEGMPAMLYRLLWLVLDEDVSLVPLGVDVKNMPTAMKFCEKRQQR